MVSCVRWIEIPSPFLVPTVSYENDWLELVTGRWRAGPLEGPSASLLGLLQALELRPVAQNCSRKVEIWASVNTGPSWQTYFSPTLQRAHFPRPHFILDSRVVNI